MRNLACSMLLAACLAAASSGCGEMSASRGVPRSARDRSPCSLSTAAELQAIIGKPLGEPVRDDSVCVFPGAGSSPRYVSLTVHWTGGRDELESARDGVKIVDSHLKKTEGMSMVEGQKIEGLGDDAFFVVAGVMPWLYVRKGDTSVAIEAFGSTQEQMVAIASAVLPRLQAASR